ncbi:ankyrin repeat-containing domain protein [Aspergillus crustosus]
MAFSKLTALPDELLLDIARNLSTKSLGRFSRTCKVAYRIASPVLYSPPDHNHNRELRHIIKWAGLHGSEQTLLFAMPKILDLIDTKPCLGYEALLFASRAGFVRLVDMLLQSGVKPNAPDAGISWGVDEIDRDMDTPLTLAIMYSEFAVARLLLRAGADLNRYEYKQLCRLLGPGGALHNVAIETLVEHGLDINTQDATSGDNLLHQACHRHVLLDIRFLIAMGLDIHKPNSRLETPLCLAIQSSTAGNSDVCDIIQFLLEQGAPANGPCNRHQWHPLHVAAARLKPEAVRLLLKHRADVNACRHDGLTALASLPNRTARCERLEEEYEVAKALLNAKASVTKNSDATKDLLKMVIERGHPRYAQCLLDAWQIQAANGLPLPLLLSATAATGDVRLIKEVLERSKPLTVTSNTAATSGFDFTPLMAAIGTGNEEVIELVANHTTNFGLVNSWGQTALHLALVKGSEKIVRLLLPLTPDIQQPDLMGDTPLIAAITHQSASIISLILSRFDELIEERKLKEQERCHTTYKPGKFWPDYILRSNLVSGLETAARLGKTETVRVLVEYMHEREVDWAQALHIAITEKHEEIALLLISQKQGLENRSSGGYTPLMNAASRGQVNIVKALIEQKVDLYAQGSRGETATSLAAAHHHCETIEFLLAGIADDIGNLDDKTEALNCQKKLIRACVKYGCAKVLEDTLSQFPPSGKTSSLNDLMLTAAAQDHAEVVQVLQWCGADVSPKGKQWRTPIGVAIAQSALQSAKVLMSAGCDMFQTDYCGRTPLAYAEDDEMIKLIYSAREATVKDKSS